MNYKFEFVTSPTKFYELLEEMGYMIYPIGFEGNKALHFVQVKDKQVRIVSGVDEMQLSVFQYIDEMNIDDVLRQQIKDELHKRISRYTAEGNLMALPLFQGSFVKDTPDISYFFFANTVTLVTKDKIELKEYRNLDGYIWESEVIKHNLRLDESFDESVFSRFLDRITQTTDGESSILRKNRLLTLMGYLMHRFRKPTLARAVILMDGCLDDNPNGGSGKGLLLQAIKKVRKVTTEDGKLFKSSQSFTFQLLSPDTMVYAFDDVPRNFNFEALFPLITEGVVLERKYKDKVHIPFDESPKVAVTTNYAINGLGDSYKRRMEEFELTKFYSATFTPADEFGHTFFYDWDSKQWNSFFNLLIHATQNYLRDGIVNAPSATGNQKKLQNMLNWEMLEFISDQIKVNDEYEVGQLFNQFISTYPDYKNLRQRTFTSWLKMFAQVNDYRWTDRHSGSLRYFAMAASNLDSIYENGCMVEFAKTI